MTAIVGEMLRNKVTQDLFKIKRIEKGKVVLLEHTKGFARIWLPKERLDSFFEKAEGV